MIVDRFYACGVNATSCRQVYFVVICRSKIYSDDYKTARNPLFASFFGYVVLWWKPWVFTLYLRPATTQP